jgi:glycosyltransferase involved in cell wall biosynthesis
LRIGIVIHDFALGGTERIAVRLANAWARQGTEVEIYCGSGAGPLRELLDADVRASAPAAPIHRGRRSVQRLAKAARAHFEAHPVQGLFVPGNYHWPLVAAIAAIPGKKRPIIVAQVSSALEKPQRGVLRQHWFEHRMRRRLAHADEIVAMSAETAILARRILHRQRITTIRLPALEDVTAPPLAVPAGPPILVAAGRLVKQKDFPTLVDAFAILDHPTARLVIIGSGPQEAAIRARIAAQDLNERVDLVGYVPDIREWLDRARLFVLPSIHEGYGAVIIEALSAGRQVIATDCTPAARELLGSTLTGRVVPINDPAALAAAMAAALESPAPDPVILARHVEGFRIGPIARSYLDLFSSHTNAEH